MARERVEPGLSQADMLRWAAVAALSLAAIGGFYYFSEQALLYRALGLVALFAAAMAVAAGSAHGQRFLEFMREARAEVRKMVWATRAETLQTSLVVFVAVIVMALFLWLLDRILSWGISLFLG